MTKPASPQSPAGTGGPAPGTIVIKRPIDRADHPIESGNYRIGTPAIEAAYTLIKQCLSHRITGALIYGPSRIGKTRAIEYLRLLMAQQNPRVTTPLPLRAQASLILPISFSRLDGLLPRSGSGQPTASSRLVKNGPSACLGLCTACPW